MKNGQDTTLIWLGGQNPLYDRRLFRRSLVNTNLFNIIKGELPEESALSTNKVNFVHFEEKAPCHKGGQATNSAGWWRGYLSIVDIAKEYDLRESYM